MVLFEFLKISTILYCNHLKFKLNMKSINFTNNEIELLKDMLDSYISYMLASGADEDYYEVRVCKSFIENLRKENENMTQMNIRIIKEKLQAELDETRKRQELNDNYSFDVGYERGILRALELVGMLK